MTKHYLIFIHGIGELNPGETLPPGYDKLWSLLIRQSGMTEQQFNEKFGRIDVVWHIGSLKQAASAIFDKAFPYLKQPSRNPMRRVCRFLMRLIREAMTFYVGDAIAYVSEDVQLIRRTVWEQIWAYRPQEATDRSFKQLLEEGATYSIVAHSLGTTIAFDYLSALFEEEKLFVSLAGFGTHPKDSDLAEVLLTPADIALLQNQFRYFFSMGSPIGLFLLRKGALWMTQETPFATLHNPIRGTHRGWCNFWDSDDPIAYPLTQLFKANIENNDCNFLDIPVETGWLFDAHLKYWKNQQVATEIMSLLKSEVLSEMLSEMLAVEYAPEYAPEEYAPEYISEYTPCSCG